MISNEHFIKSFYDDAFSESKIPTSQEIAKYELYQCERCYEWFSFLQTK